MRESCTAISIGTKRTNSPTTCPCRMLLIWNRSAAAAAPSFPYFVGKILEIPLTTSQDYSLFQILNDYSIDLWKKQARSHSAQKWTHEFHCTSRLPD